MIGRPNGRNFYLLKEVVPQLRCDGLEFMFYETWHDKIEEIKSVVKSLPLPVVVFHLEKQIGELDAERKSIDNKRRRAKTEDEKDIYYAEIRSVSSKIKPIRDKLRIAKATLDTVPKVQKLLDIEREMENKIIQKERNKER